MSTIVIPPDINRILTGTCSIVYFLFAIIVLIYHITSVYKHNDGNLKFRSHPSIILSYLLLFVGIICGIDLSGDFLMGNDDIISNEWCQISKYIGPSLYNTFKTMLYLILICRVWKAFQNSQLQYDTKKLSFWAILLIIWTIFNLIYGNMTVKTAHNPTFPKCSIEPSKPFILSIVLLDITSTVVNCILFVRPLIKLHKLTDFDITVKNIAIKQCILSMIAVISSILAMIGVGLFNSPPIFVSIDLMISTSCIILMYKWNSHIVVKIFSCCISSYNQTEHVKNLQSVVKESTTTKTTKSMVETTTTTSV